ncbi:hypothetical protein CDL15_Pgr003435 [Punica granatum]|uniref:Uncharacterized protein n=1 Tax=Punica granatum TaxID=22663 RepID=A0A218X2T3_PUNGR|nr:hypothetical protein CDL15_Pgr003435 [Punica granatum]
MGRTGLLGRTGLMDRTGLDWAGLAGLGRWAVGHGTRLGRDRLDWWKTSEGGARWFERFGRLLQAGEGTSGSLDAAANSPWSPES